MYAVCNNHRGRETRAHTRTHKCHAKGWLDNDMEIKWRRESMVLLMLHFTKIHPYTHTHTNTQAGFSWFEYIALFQIHTKSIAQPRRQKSMELICCPQVLQLWKYSFWIMHLLLLYQYALCFVYRKDGATIKRIKWKTNLWILLKKKKKNHLAADSLNGSIVSAIFMSNIVTVPTNPPTAWKLCLPHLQW